MRVRHRLKMANVAALAPAESERLPIGRRRGLRHNGFQAGKHGFGAGDQFRNIVDADFFVGHGVK